MSAFVGTCCGGLMAIAKFCEQYALGLSNVIHIAEACDLDTIPAPDAETHTISSDVVMDSGKVFYQWVLGDVDLEFNYASVGIVGSQSFQNTVTVFIPIQRSVIEHQLNSIINGEFVLEFGDKEGARRLGGNENSPMRIPEGGIQGVINGERNGTTVTFQNVSATPYFYTGAIPLTAV